MTSQTERPKIRGEIRYHDYLLLAVAMDSEWSRLCKSAEDFPPLHNHVNFRRNCLDYGQGINENYDDWRKANHATDPAKYVDRRILNPLSYFAMGHADDACFVLLDDAAPAHHLTIRIARRIEDVSLAYCPRVKELVESAKLQAEGGEDGLSVFAEPHEFFDEEHGPCNPEMGISRRIGDSVDISFHTKQKELPFLVFTKYRIDGLCEIGYFLLAQQAVYKAMIRRIHSNIKRLEAGAEDTDPPNMLSKEDVRSAKCCLLDLQGVEEIGTMVFCRNLTVAMSIVAGLRRLRFFHAFAAEPEFRVLLENDDTFRLAVEKDGGRPDHGEEYTRQIKGNHLFRWTSSAVFVAPGAFLHRDYRNCHGVVRARLRCQLSCGHRSQALEIIRGKAERAETGRNGWDYLLVGQQDLTEPVVPAASDHVATSAAQEPVRTDSLIQDMHRKMSQLAAGMTGGDMGRHCVEFAAELEVPVPPIEYDDDKPGGSLQHNAIFMRVLANVKDKLCPPLPSRTTFDEPPRPVYPLSTMALSYYQRRAGLPIHLRQTIESLYQIFFTILADPHRFDLVLDFYDVFATLHRLITRALPAKIQGKRSLGGGIPLLDEGRVLAIAELASAMDNALRHRVAKVFPVDAPEDMAVDFRGGLNQVLLAAMAPMACALGLFRRYVVQPLALEGLVPPDDDWGGSPNDFRSLVGVVSEISIVPGMRCCALRLGYEGIGFPQLAYYKVDVPHVLHVANYADYFHESAHLVFRNLFRPDAPKKYTDESLEPIWRLRTEDESRFLLVEAHLGEVFAILMSHVFLYGTDLDAPFAYYVSAFSRSLTSIGDETEERAGAEQDSIVRCMDHLLRLFVVRRLLSGGSKQGVEDPKAVNEQLKGEVRIGRSTDRDETEFLAFIKWAGKYIPEYSDLWCGPLRPAAEEYARKTVRNMLPTISKCVPWIWKCVRTIYGLYVHHSLLPDGRHGLVDGFIRKEIDAAFCDGTPILRCRMPILKDAQVRTEFPDEPRDRFVDTLYLISRMLHQYIRMTIEGSFGVKRTVLPRDPSSGKIRYEAGTEEPYREWWEFQIDRGSAALFCPVPETRRARILKEIVICKTFRDIASTLQSRRLYRIIFDSLKDLGVHPNNSVAAVP